ncbi:MAG TPA: BMP family ABC transporter substrate-binding protein [Streptosporangiaceae bacterium]|nr:BMP family ABC transporter substrate-binding protein [Streptosporangiaceae bacterium]
MRGSLKTVAALSVLAIAAAGCGSSSSSKAPSGGGKSSSSTAAAPAFTACMVTDTGGLDDKSFNQSSWAGFQAAQSADSSIAIKNLPSTSTADYAKNISTFIGEHCGIIVTVGFLMASATETAAKANPNQKFAIVDCSYGSGCLPKPELTNIDQLTYNTVQDGFLGGYLAAAISKTGKVATYGGEQFGTVTIYEDGFWDGVQYYNKQKHKNVTVLGWDETTQKGTFAGSFTNLGAGQQIANTFINEGADVIFPVAGGVGLGSAKAVQTANAAGKNVSMMWVDTDGCVSAAPYCKYFVTSVEKGITTSVTGAITSAKDGTFKGGTYIGTLSNGGAVLAPFHDFASKIPASLVSELNSLKAQIESGKIVPATKSPVS